MRITPHFNCFSSCFISKPRGLFLICLLLVQCFVGLCLDAASGASTDSGSSLPTQSNGVNNTLMSPDALLSASGETSKPERAIRVGDSILYRVIEDRDEAIILPVMETGEIIIPYYGQVMAVGMTPKDLSKKIEELLMANGYKKATVQLALQTGATPFTMGTVYMGGRINRIGTVQIDPARQNTVAKIIIGAGGFADFADSSDVRIVRRSFETGEVETIHVDVRSVIEDGKLDNDVQVMDGDFIIVPKRLFNW